MEKRTTKEEALNRIATEILQVETLETRNSDSLDFHDMAVWTIQRALEAAYDAGKESGRKEQLITITRRRNEDAGQRRERLTDQVAEFFNACTRVSTRTWMRWEREVQSLAEMIGEDMEVVRQAIIDDGHMIQSGF